MGSVAAIPAKNITVGIQAGTEFTFYATWKWTAKNTAEYKTLWQFDTGNGVWFVGSDSTTKYTQSTYSVPNNAKRVRFKVQPVATKTKVDNVEKPAWVAPWSAVITKTIPWAATATIPTPSVPTVEVVGKKLTAEISNISTEGGPTHVQFQVVKGTKTVVNTTSIKIARPTNYVKLTYNSVAAKSSYKVRARCYKGNGKGINTSAWTEFSDPISTPDLLAPSTPDIEPNNLKLKMSLSIYNEGKPTHVRFHIVKNNSTADADNWTTSWIKIKTNYAQYTFTKGVANANYKVQAQCCHDEKGGDYDVVSPWSEYTDNVTLTADPVPEMPAPPTPTVEIKNLTLRAYVSVYNERNPNTVVFRIVKNNSESGAVEIPATIITNYASISKTVDAGAEYKVKAYCKNASQQSDWSEYSSPVSTGPGSITSKNLSVDALTESSAIVKWDPVSTAENYEIQYTDTADYFDKSPDNVHSVTVEAVVSSAIVTGMDTGKIWYFRIRATNSNGSGGWSPIVKTRLGTTPTAPTTWSYTASVPIGKDVILNWVHNDEDGSEQSEANVRLTINGTTSTFPVSGNTNVYRIPTNSYIDGTIIYWEVQTRGAMPSWSPWSTKRQVSVYAQPEVNVQMFTNGNWIWDSFEFAVDTIYTAKSDGNEPLIDNTVNHFPIYILATAFPASQKAISFVVSIIANDAYDSVNELGQPTRIQKGAEVYKQYFTSLPNNELSLALNAGDVSLENSFNYTLKVIAAMDTGLSGEGAADFEVAWDSDVVTPDADVAIDTEQYCTYIHPYCADGFMDALLSVYRREYDGTFTPIGVNIDANDETTIIDPHPALDFARYRITALSKISGIVSYYDIPPQEIGCSSIVIQWDEEWHDFDIDDLGLTEQPAYDGSMLILPYNVDVQNDVKRDVALVEYIGRKNPVSYYGTQRGETATWSSDIPADDADTLYKIRQLSDYAGDVYVREPSGIGYWANVTVSYKLQHTKMAVPVTLSITRVDGGM